jgi:predicted dienelactone hydrolase
VSDGLKRPLVVFSHGAGGNGAGYAWFGEYLASHGYLVALIYHYRANTYDSSALYVRSRLWQRPRDIGLILSRLIQDHAWGPLIDADRIGVAGHSQGGFTALWLGGAEVDPELFLRFQRQWKTNPAVPAYLREQMQPDAEPTRHLRDPRVKTAFAMAPGDLPGFGMDEAGLGRMAIPAYIIVGAGDTTTPPAENAEFAARHIPQAQLDVLPGPVGHEIFGNECDQIGRDNFPEACNDAPGVDRARLHEHIAMLRAAGWLVNDKRVERIWRREGLKVRKHPVSAHRMLTVSQLVHGSQARADRFRVERTHHDRGVDSV